MALQDIQQRLSDIELEKEKATTLKEMLKDALESDIPFQEAAAEQKDWAAKAKQAKEAAYTAANGDEIQEQIAEINQKIKSLQELLSYELVQYYQEYKTNEFTDSDGNTRRFKVGATMVRGKSDEELPASLPGASTSTNSESSPTVEADAEQE